MLKNVVFVSKSKKFHKNSFVEINSFIVDIWINRFFVVNAFVDIKCFLYDIVNDKFEWHFNILHVFIQFRFLKTVKNDKKSIKKIIRLNINFLNHKNKKICMYIFNETFNSDILLELFWTEKNDVWINAKNKWL